MKPKTTWTENDELFYLAPMVCIASENRTLGNPDSPGKELKKWAEFIKALCEAANNEAAATPDEILDLIKRQKKKIRTIYNHLSANGKDPALIRKVELILSECTIDD